MKTSFRTPPFSLRAAHRPHRRLPTAALVVCCALVAFTGRAVTLKALVAFNGTNGARPYAQMLRGTNGCLYGTTSEGGAYNLGTVFSLTPAGQLTNLVSFDGTNGAKPLAGLLQGVDGNFYGTTAGGGSNGCGTVFMLTPSGQLTSLASFNSTNGLQPQGTLVQAANGKLYGTTLYGGAYGNGVLFTLTPQQGTVPLREGGAVQPLLTVPPLGLLYSFDGTNSGALPAAGLALGADGNLYGTTSSGGSLYNAGTVFQYSLNRGALQTLFFFATTNGSSPQAGLALGADGLLYGTTAGGGTNASKTGGDGTLFNIGVYAGFSSLWSFAGSNGASPFAGLVQGTDGNFYGVTTAGGGKNRGALFNYNTNSGLSLLYSFSGGSDGAAPYGGLVQGTNGDFYGVTSAGGKDGLGTIFDVSGFAPYIIIEPSTNVAAQAGATLTLAVTAGGTAPLKYQWQLNTNNVGNGRGISGATGPTLTISNSLPANSGNYQVIVRNAYGSATSGVAVVTVVEPYGATPPTLKISSPAQNTYLSTMTPLVTLTAGGTVAVARVYFELNGAGWQLATPVNGKSTWTAKLALSPGPNLFEAYAVNIAGTPSLTHQAVFVPGPFTPVAPAGGTYHGLFYDTNQVAWTNAGFFTLTPTPAGKLSGSLLLQGARYALTGLLADDGSALVVVPRPNASSLLLWLQFDLTNGTDRVTGLISNQTWQAELDGDRAVFDGKVSKAPQQGHYTLLIPGADSASSPGGDSWATVSVDAAGNIVLAGWLADGTPLNQAVPVSKSGQWPFFASLYSGQGLIIGWLAFTNGAAPTLGGDVAWLKPPLAGAKYYPGGFALSTNATGVSYVAPGAGTNVLSTTNALVIVTGGNLGARSITNRITLNAKSVVANHSTNALSLSFSVPGGSFKGTVQDPVARQSLAFSGVVLQNQDQAVGYFTGTNQTGQVQIAPLPVPSEE